MLAQLIFLSLGITNSFSSPLILPSKNQSQLDYEDSIIIQPIRNEDIPPQLCVLSFPFDTTSGGTEMDLKDCLTFPKYEKFPPTYVLRYHGINPVVCCPPPDVVLFPDEFEQFSNYVFKESSATSGGPEYNYDYGDTDDYEETIYPQCPHNCVRHSFCNLTGTEKPPKFCGWNDESGEDLFCCEKMTNEENTPQEPQYGNFGCRDFHSHCKEILKLNSSACDGDFRSSQFMRVACMETCKKCGTKGCVDEFVECKQWTRNGFCSKYAPFMVYNCRESCGTCGMRSDVVSTSQIVNGKDFSDVTSPNFFCGTLYDNDVKQRLVDVLGEELFKPSPIAGMALPEIPDVSLRQDFPGDEDKKISCGSVLINDRFILTAAHCEEQFTSKTTTRSVVIRHGTKYMETIKVKRTFMHPEYRFPLGYNDVALSELSRRVMFDFEKYGDSPMCCGKLDLLDGKQALVQGFGLTEKGEQSAGLLQANVTIISNEKCAKILNHNVSDHMLYKQRTKNTLKYGIIDQVMCSVGTKDEKTGNTSGPCEGDSGGPLFQQETTEEGFTKSSLIGIVAGGLGCGINIPTWYTRISKFLPWMGCIVGAAKLGISTEAIGSNCGRIANKIIKTENEIN